MKHTKTEVIPEHTEEVVTHTTCDICKRSSKGKDRCEFGDTDIMFRDVEMTHPECGNGTTYSYDICHDCFRDKVIPALKELGAEPTVEDWDY